MAKFALESVTQPASQLKPISMPPPAAAETFKNERRLYCVFIFFMSYKVDAIFMASLILT